METLNDCAWKDSSFLVHRIANVRATRQEPENGSLVMAWKRLSRTSGQKFSGMSSGFMCGDISTPMTYKRISDIDRCSTRQSLLRN